MLSAFLISFLMLFAQGKAGGLYRDAAINPKEDGEFFNFRLKNSSVIRIDGSSNIDAFSCSAKQNFPLSTGIMMRTDNPGKFLFRNTSLCIPVKSLSCDNAAMDYDMYKALKANSCPYITLNLREADIPSGMYGNSAGGEALICADVSIAGRVVTQYIQLHMRRITADEFRFSGSHGMLLSDFDIDPPAALFGMIRVKDPVEIVFDLDVLINSAA